MSPYIVAIDAVATVQYERRKRRRKKLRESQEKGRKTICGSFPADVKEKGARALSDLKFLARCGIRHCLNVCNEFAYVPKCAVSAFRQFIYALRITFSQFCCRERDLSRTDRYYGNVAATPIFFMKISKPPLTLRLALFNDGKERENKVRYIKTTAKNVKNWREAETRNEGEHSRHDKFANMFSSILAGENTFMLYEFKHFVQGTVLHTDLKTTVVGVGTRRVQVFCNSGSCHQVRARYRDVMGGGRERERERQREKYSPSLVLPSILHSTMYIYEGNQ